MTEMETFTDLAPAMAIPPGKTLRDEIRERGITQVELAKRMGRPTKVINQIITGKKAITADTALQLESVIGGISAMFWLRLEAGYRLALARQEASVTA